MKNLPQGIPGKNIILDPMLATGNSANEAISGIKKHEATDIHFTSILAAPEGVKAMKQRHPEVPLHLLFR